MNPGDIIIRKFRGVKTLFRVLGLDDVINENCYHVFVAPMPTTHYHPIQDRQIIEDLHWYCLNIDLDNYTLSETHAVGDKVLVRNFSDEPWKVKIFGHFDESGKVATCNGDSISSPFRDRWNQWINYKEGMI